MEETGKSLAQFRRWVFWLRDSGPRPLGTFYFRNSDRRRGITFVVAETANFAINDFVEYRQKRIGRRKDGRGRMSGTQLSEKIFPVGRRDVFRFYRNFVPFFFLVFFRRLLLKSLQCCGIKFVAAPLS